MKRGRWAVVSQKRRSPKAFTISDDQSVRPRDWLPEGDLFHKSPKKQCELASSETITVGVDYLITRLRRESIWRFDVEIRTREK